MKTSNNGITMISVFEQYHDGNLQEIGLQPKMCPAGVWTVGLGHALLNKKTGKWLKGQADYHLIAEQYPEYLTMTRKQADELLKLDLVEYENKVNKAVKVELKQHQFDALVSYVYNIGWSDTMFRYINAKVPTAQIITWWETHYITADGKVLKGLINRRKSEAYYYRTGIMKFFK